MQKNIVLKAKARDLIANQETVADEVLLALHKLFGIDDLDEEVELTQSVELFLFEILDKMSRPQNPYDLGMYMAAAGDLEVLKASLPTADLPVLSSAAKELFRKYLSNNSLFENIGTINFIPINKKGESVYLLPLPITNILHDAEFNKLIYKVIS